MAIRQEALENLKKVYASQNVVSDPKPSGPDQKQPPAQETPLSLIENRLAQLEEISVELLTSIIARQDQIDRNLAEFVKAVTVGGGEDRSFYTPKEFAAKLVSDGHKKHITERRVRLWCHDGRINAKKRPAGRGEHGEFMIPASEYDRYVNYGLLPVPKD